MMLSIYRLFLRRCGLWLGASLLFAAPFACGQAPSSAPPAAALETLDLHAAARLLSPELQAALRTNPANPRNLAVDLLTRRLSAAQARAAGLDQDPVVALQLRQAAERVLHEAWLRQQMKAALAPAAAEQLAREEYRAFPERFERDAEVHVRHILVAACSCAGADDPGRKLADELHARLLGGEDFAALAAAHSIDQANAENGGDLGFFGRGRMVPEFEEAAFALVEPGDLAPVVKTRFGYHLIRLEARRSAGMRSFDEVREELVAAQLAAQRRRARGAAIDELRNSPAFELDDDALAAATARLQSATATD